MVALRFLFLLASVILAGDLHHTHAAHNVYSRDEELLLRWDFWPPLLSSPRFSGHYLGSRPGRIRQSKQSFEAVDLFDGKQFENNQEQGNKLVKNALLYGNVLLDPIVVPSALLPTDPAVQAAFAASVAVIKKHAAMYVSPDITITHAVIYPLKVTGDNGETEVAIVQEYTDANHQTRRFKSHVTFGLNFYLTLEDAKFNKLHRVVVALDRDGVHNLFQHTYAPLITSPSSSSSESSVTSEECHAVVTINDKDACVENVMPRILSYNVWNTNPSADVYGYANRWKQYKKRLDHLVSFVKKSQASIIGFQEVRYDGKLGTIGNHAQVQHLADRLPGYQYVYQAAMSYFNDNSPYERIEEGPAIFSKFPILKTDYLLLSRDPNDPNDAHQRLCLHAVIDFPRWGLIDVYVTHLSLSERSREQTMVEIWNYMQEGTGKTQVLLGDLNAEPQSRGIQFLRGEAELLGATTNLKDAWLEKHDEATPRSMDPIDRHSRFTFPSDNPSKRIDFVLYRGKGDVKECEILGQAPTEDTKDFPQDVGMLDHQSPVYASDHRGVVVEFE